MSSSLDFQLPFWCFSAVILLSAVFTTMVPKIKYALIGLWVTGLSVGGLYLTLGAEVLAVIQCINSTLVTISLVFFAVMFGEFAPAQTDSPESGQPSRRDRVFLILSLLLGASFGAVIWIGNQGGFSDFDQTPPADPTAGGIGSLGQALTQDHLLSLEVLALTLFLVLIGGGVIARLERNEEP